MRIGEVQETVDSRRPAISQRSSSPGEMAEGVVDEFGSGRNRGRGGNVVGVERRLWLSMADWSFSRRTVQLGEIFGEFVGAGGGEELALHVERSVMSTKLMTKRRGRDRRRGGDGQHSAVKELPSAH